MHFLIDCTKYDNKKSVLQLQNLQSVNNSIEKFTILLSSNDNHVIVDVCTFLEEAAKKGLPFALLMLTSYHLVNKHVNYSHY